LFAPDDGCPDSGAAANDRCTDAGPAAEAEPSPEPSGQSDSDATIDQQRDVSEPGDAGDVEAAAPKPDGPPLVDVEAGGGPDANDGHDAEGGACACSGAGCGTGVGCGMCSGLLDPGGFNVATIPLLSSAGVGDGIIGASYDGSVMFLTSSASVCAWDTLKIAIKTSLVDYVVHTVTGQPKAAGTAPDVAELSWDGKKIILGSADRTRFLLFPISDGVVGDGSVGPFGPINGAVAPGALLYRPVLSADELTFYFQTVSTNQAVAGIYFSVRTTITEDFPPATKMPDAFQNYMAVNAVSADDLTLFVSGSDFNSYLFTRTDRLQPFTNPNGNLRPPMIPLFGARPFDGCAAVIGTCTPGGCWNEDSCWARHR
jgi:hypothetical protein